MIRARMISKITKKPIAPNQRGFERREAIIDGAGASNTCTFNGRTADGTVSGAEYIVIKISAHENWTGYISQVAVTWG